MKEVHLICNAHIDPIWQWDWQEGVSATLSTFQSAVDLCEEFDYIFCHNEVTVYKYVEEYAPALFERIRALVKAGKWHIMGGWYLQPDCNMPSGESFVRQIREGHRYFKEKFGVTPKTAINFDPFGHTVGLVQIVKKCGQDSYMFMRPYPSEMELPAEQFVWQGLDGSEITAVRTGPYNSPLGSSAEVIRARAEGKDGDVVGKCPMCGKDFVRTRFRYACVGKDAGCDFSVGMSICGREIPVSAVQDLLENGKTKKMNGFYSKKTGKTFSGALKIDDGKVVFDFG